MKIPSRCVWIEWEYVGFRLSELGYHILSNSAYNRIGQPSVSTFFYFYHTFCTVVAVVLIIMMALVVYFIITSQKRIYCISLRITTIVMESSQWTSFHRTLHIFILFSTFYWLLHSLLFSTSNLTMHFTHKIVFFAIILNAF